jgi:hypothetical protein
VTSNADNKKDKPAPERRAGIDRRRVDLGPPNGIERRKGMEPRKPDVQEVDLTASDWANFDAQQPLKPKKPTEGG